MAIAVLAPREICAVFAFRELFNGQGSIAEIASALEFCMLKFPTLLHVTAFRQDGTIAFATHVVVSVIDSLNKIRERLAYTAKVAALGRLVGIAVHD